MISTDQILEKAAHDGSISLDDWANSLQEILQRLHDVRDCHRVSSRLDQRIRSIDRVTDCAYRVSDPFDPSAGRGAGDG